MGAKITVKEYTELEGHKQGVYALIHLRGTSTIVSGGGDGAVVKWDLNFAYSERDGVSNVEFKDDQVMRSQNSRASVEGVLFAQLPEPIFCLMQGADDAIWAGTQGGWLFKLDVGAPPRMVKLGPHAVFFVSEWLDGRIAVGLGNGELVFLNNELQELDRKLLGRKSLRCCLGNRGLIGGSDGLIWQLNDKGEVLGTWQGNQPSVFCLALDAMGDVVSGGRDALLRWMDKHGGLRQEVKAHLYTIHALIGTDLGWMASGSMDKTVKIWDGVDGILLKVIDRAKYPGRGHSHAVNALCQLPLPQDSGSRRLLASAGDDKIIRVWVVG